MALAARYARALLFLFLALALVLPGCLAESEAPVVIPANPLFSGNADPVEQQTAPQTQTPDLSSQPEAPAGESVPGEEIALTDEQTQEWYDEMYERAANYVVPDGVVTGNALRVPGQETLDDIEIEIQLALEGSQLGVNELISSDGRMNIMLIGVDARPGQKTGRSDTMILCSVDLTGSGTIKLISFMRDMYVQIPNLNPNRMNTAYFKGGADLFRQTLEKNFGITFDHYVAVNFSVLGSIIDQLGGLEIDLTEQYFVDRVNAVIKNDNLVLGINENDGLVKGPGLQTLTGKQSQAYARFRYGAKSGGDFGRTERQREVIMKIFNKVKGLSLLEMADMAVKNIESVNTDLSIGDLIKLIPTVLKLQDAQFEQLRIPQDGQFEFQTINGMSVIVADTKKAVSAVQEFLYGE